MSNIKEWIEEWNEIFPIDAKWNGNKLRTDIKYCVNKMQKFCKDNPQYTKDIIFAATKMYVKEKEKVNWEYARQSTYFISKIGFTSLLEEYCQKIIKPEKEQSTQEVLYNPIDDFI